MVGIPVEGPPLITFTTKAGVSLAIDKPKASLISDKPGPEVAVMEGLPPNEPPITMLIAANSSSAIITAPPTFSKREDKYSTISVAGVMG